jgi:hypothetical protein
MSVRLLTCAVLGLVLAAGPMAAADPPKPGTTEHTLAALREPVDIDRVNERTLSELLEQLTAKHDITFMIREWAFTAAGTQGLQEQRPRVVISRFKGMALHRFLTMILDGMGATYLVRKDHVEIVPIMTAAKETKNLYTEEQGDGTNVRLREPLVAVSYKEKPLNEALADLAEEYDLTVVVGPQAGDARMGFVTARLLNVPADRAVELLALQADLAGRPPGHRVPGDEQGPRRGRARRGGRAGEAEGRAGAGEGGSAGPAAPAARPGAEAGPGAEEAVSGPLRSRRRPARRRCG